MKNLWFAYETTPECNLKCPFCYNIWSDKKKTGKAVLSLTEIRRLADVLASIPALRGITLTGGEPLLRDDILDISKAFSTKGISTALATNGTLLTRESAVQLADSGIEHFDIGFTNPSHETIMALTYAVRTGRTVTASLCIHRGNYEKTGIRVRTASALGVHSVCLNRFVPTGRGRDNCEALALSDIQLHRAFELAQEAYQTCPVHMYTGIPESSAAGFPAISPSTCRCGETKWAIDPSGNLRTCEQSAGILGNLLENSFEDILSSCSAEISEFRKLPAKKCRFLN